MNQLPLRPAAALLSRAALENNIGIIRSRIQEAASRHRRDAKIMAVVKANAYGHELKRILPALEKNKIHHFAVASLAEAALARSISAKAHLLVLGGTFHWTKEAIDLARKLRLELAVSDLESLKVLSKYPEIPIHLKLDTGMNRLGLKPSDWAEGVFELHRRGRRIEGLFTHYATAQDEIFQRQTMLFEEGVRWFFSEGFRPRWVHCENSAGIFSSSTGRKGILSEVVNFVRPGISLYGYTSRGLKPIKGLQPVLRLVSEVSLLKGVEAGEGVSYGHLYRARAKHAFGIVPLGYADGLSKSYGPYLRPLLEDARGRAKGRLRILGSICMDMVMLKAEPGKLEVGDRVTFWGRPGQANEVLKHKIVEAYELNLRISQRIPRIWIR